MAQYAQIQKQQAYGKDNAKYIKLSTPITTPVAQYCPEWCCSTMIDAVCSLLRLSQTVALHPSRTWRFKLVLFGSIGAHLTRNLLCFKFSRVLFNRKSVLSHAVSFWLSFWYKLSILIVKLEPQQLFLKSGCCRELRMVFEHSRLENLHYQTVCV